jgi:hypothetical protein
VDNAQIPMVGGRWQARGGTGCVHELARVDPDGDSQYPYVMRTTSATPAAKREGAVVGDTFRVELRWFELRGVRQ